MRSQFDWFSNVVDNKPMLLMSGREFLDGNLKKCNVTREDIFAKLREANAINYDQVLAVVFESTGDISVLHQPGDGPLKSDFMADVVDANQLHYLQP